MDNDKLLAYLRVTNEICRRSQYRMAKNASEAPQLQEAANKAAKSCVTNERLLPEQAEALAEKLASDHGSCLEFIEMLARHRNAAELETIGKPVGGEKQSGTRYTGGRIADHDETEAGRRFRERLLGNV